MIYRVLSGERLLAAGAGAGPVLGLETGGPEVHIGLVTGGRIAAALSRPVKSHGSGLPLAVEEALKAAGIGLGDLTAIAIGIGPGSFTGLRVGLSYAKGIAAGIKIQIVGISSLDAMALCGSGSAFARPGTKICPVIDAHRGEVYTSLYEVVTDALEKKVDDLAVPLDEFAPAITGEVLFVGESKAEEARMLTVQHGGTASVAAGVVHQGSFIAALGAARVARGDTDDPGTLQPLYIRAAGASVKSTAIEPGERTHGTPRRRVDPAACGS